MYQLWLMCFNMSSRSYFRIVKKASVRAKKIAGLKFFFILFLSVPFTLFSQEKQQTVKLSFDSLPEIKNLSRTDVIYRQFCQVVDYNAKEAAKGPDYYQNQIEEYYSYTAKETDDLLSIHAATGIPYDTIATLNNIQDNSEKIQNRKLIIPTIKGIYAELNPTSTLQILISRENAEFVANSNSPCYNFNGHNYKFLSQKRLSSTQRAFFLDSSMSLPLDSIRITSEYGYRTSPVYRTWKFHKGVDFGAKEGTQVYACKGGTVSTCIKNDPIFGNYIILSHSGGMTSVYAHLSKIFVTKGEIVQKGKVIGLVGQTGKATGPHLHFEIRQNGIATDPSFIYER